MATQTRWQDEDLRWEEIEQPIKAGWPAPVWECEAYGYRLRLESRACRYWLYRDGDLVGDTLDFPRGNDVRRILNVNHVACGWAFDCGMREAEVDAARALWLGGREATAAAIAAERARCEAERAALLAVLSAARQIVAAADACDREAERHPSSRSSAPVVRAINAMKLLREAVSGAPAPREG